MKIKNATHPDAQVRTVNEGQYFTGWSENHRTTSISWGSRSRPRPISAVRFFQPSPNSRSAINTHYTILWAFHVSTLIADSWESSKQNTTSYNVEFYSRNSSISKKSVVRANIKSVRRYWRTSPSPSLKTKATGSRLQQTNHVSVHRFL